MVDLATVEYTVEGPIALNRPERRNALDHQLLDDIDAAFDAAERNDEVRVVVLSGDGPSFCSGHDLKGSYQITPPEGGWTAANGLERLRGIKDRYRRIWDFPKPTIAREAERIGLVIVAVPAEELDATVEAIAADCAAVPAAGQRRKKETLDTDLEIMGVGALFRYHGQMNALGRLKGS